MEKPSLSVAVLLLLWSLFGLSLGVFPFLAVAQYRREWLSLKESHERMLSGVENAKKANNYYFVFINDLIGQTYYEIGLQAQDRIPPERGYVARGREKCTVFGLQSTRQADLFSISIAAYARRGNQLHAVAIKLDNVPPGSTCQLVDFPLPEQYLLAGMTCRNGDVKFTTHFFPNVVDSLREAGHFFLKRPNVHVQAVKTGAFQPHDVVASLKQSRIIPFQPEELATNHRIYATITNNLRQDVEFSVRCTLLDLDHHQGSGKPRPKQESRVIFAGVIEPGTGPQEVDLERTVIAFKQEEPYTITMKGAGKASFEYIGVLRGSGKTDGGPQVPYASYTVEYRNPNKEAAGVHVHEQGGPHI